MAAARANNLPELVRYDLRPTLVEARLITDKHAHDAPYVAALSEQLRQVERKITALEEALHLDSPCAEATPAMQETPADPLPDLNWIRTKSSQLCSRLRHIEESSVRTQ